ncbi:MAG: site-specific integrase [Chloroflexi bacterium]|nr:site-specific integrase [Chloroflexota bacterium]
MRGCIIKRGDSYRIKVSLGKDPKTGKYISHYETVGSSKKAAEKRLNELIHQYETGSYVKPSKGTLAEFLERWLRDYAYINVSQRTAEEYEAIIQRHLIPAFGGVLLVQLQPNMIQSYITEKLENGRIDGSGGLSNMSVKHHIVCLHTALQYAVKMGLIVRNPVDAVIIPKTKRPEMKFMNESDVKRFLELAKNTPYYILFYLAIFTGMRRSELLALRWQDIDFGKGQVYITRSLHHLKNTGALIFKEPKSEKSRRAVALSPSTVELLKEHKITQNNFRLSLGYLAFNENDLIFCHYDGKPLLPNTITHNWIKLTKKAGLEGIRLHDARHTHASLMLKQGVHPKIVQERLGHSSIQVTLDTYSHVTPGLQESAARAFDNLVLTGV